MECLAEKSLEDMKKTAVLSLNAYDIFFKYS